MQMRFIVAGALALVLAGCGSADKPEAAATEAPAATEAAPATSAAAAAPAAAPAKGDKPSKEFVVGKWGNDGDCTMAIDLKADGTSDGPFGNWTYADGVIGFADTPEAKITVTVADDKTMNSVNAQGGKHQMTRCP
jgi:nucleoid-associated protein YgaU